MLKRLWVIGLVTLVALSTTALPAHAATADLPAANRAGAWLAGQLVDGHLAGADAGSQFGNTAVGLVGLVAADDPGLTPAVEAMRSYLAAAAPTEGRTSSRAAVLAIAADALGLAPTAFGVDPVAEITRETAADGAIGSWPNAYSQGFALVGLARAGVSPTDLQVSWLVGQQDPSGAFGYADWSTGAFVADPDSTALAVMGLSVSGRADARAASDRAAAWLTDAQLADGSWAAWSPVNTTALAGMALASRGADVTKALAWVASQQDASGALLFDGDPDAYATSQALVFLGGTSYRTVTWRPRAVVTPAPTVTVTAPPAPQPTVTVKVPTTTRVTVRPTTVRTVTRNVTVTAASSSAPAAESAAPTASDPTPTPTPSATPTPSTSVAPARPAASAAPTASASPAGSPDLPLYLGGAAMLAAAAGGGFWLLRKR